MMNCETLPGQKIFCVGKARHRGLLDLHLNIFQHPEMGGKNKGSFKEGVSLICWKSAVFA